MLPFTWLCFLSLGMWVGSIIPGYLPLMCAMSQARVRSLTVLGAGLLIGTALIVIIPEGVHMWYDVQSHDVAPAVTAEGGGGLGGVSGDTMRGEVQAGQAWESQGTAVGAGSDVDAHDAGHSHNHKDAHRHEDHWQIGLSLAMGFVFMLLVDRLGMGGGHGHSHGHVHSTPDSDAARKAQAEEEGKESGDRSLPVPAKSATATFGLLIHAGVDGVALGSAALSNKGSLSMIVFMAIMLHKAPAAFGLASYLLHQGLRPAQVRQQLLTFASVAPLGAIATFLFLGFSGEISPGVLALMLFFSGGTFLYIATCHILPDLQVPHPMNKAELTMFVIGVVVPVLPSFLNLDHGH